MNKLADEYHNTYHRSVGKKPIHADYFPLIEEIQSSHKAPKFKVGDRVRITKYNNIFSKDSTKKCLNEMFVIDSVLETNLWTNKIKDLNGETIIGRFNEKELLLSKL